MNSFANGKLKAFHLTNGLAKLLGDCERAHGEEALLATAEPAVLQTLRHHSIVTSCETSCAIEGIVLPPDRKEAVLEREEKPLNRDEREVQNYRRALEFIYTPPPDRLRLTPELIRLLHSMVKDGAAEAGEWKLRNNFIIEERAGAKRIRFQPLEHELVEEYVSQLCLEYTDTIQAGETPPLVAIAAFTLDVTAIHPFADGNGRVSRLVTAAALIEQGYQLPKYVSLEELIRERSESYYDALEKSSQGWRTGGHNVEPFVRFQLETIMLGYKLLYERRERIKEPVGVLLSPSLPAHIATSIKSRFLEIYPNASFLDRDVRGGTLSAIEGFRSDLPKEEWDRLHRAKKLVESLIVRALKKDAL